MDARDASTVQPEPDDHRCIDEKDQPEGPRRQDSTDAGYPVLLGVDLCPSGIHH